MNTFTLAVSQSFGPPAPYSPDTSCDSSSDAVSSPLVQHTPPSATLPLSEAPLCASFFF